MTISSRQHALLLKVLEQDKTAEMRVPELIELSPGVEAHRIRAEVLRDRSLQTDSVALELLHYYEEHRMTLTPVASSSIVEAAILAAHGSQDFDLLTRLHKSLAYVEGLLSNFDDATKSLARADGFADRTADAAFLHLVVAFGRARLAYDMRRTDEAADLLAAVIDGFERIGEHGDASAARGLLACIDFRRGTGDPEEMLRVSLDEAAAARVCGDQVALANALAHAGVFLLKLRRPDAAQRALDASLEICREHGMLLVEARARRLCAEITIHREGVAAGLREMKRVRARFVELNMPAEGTIALVDAVEAIVDVDPSSSEIVPLCRQIQIEATKLDLKIDAATATERLLRAAVRRESLHDHLTYVRGAINPVAGYAESSVTH